MASSIGTQPPSSQVNKIHSPLSGHQGANTSILLEKTKAGMRGSTPDSEALASSDDEQDHHNRLQQVHTIQSSRPTRRPSWFTETQHVSQRKGSLGGGGSFSPSHSYISSPSSEQGTWTSSGAQPASGVGRGHSSNSSIPWGSAIWSNDSQKGPPSRLTEVLPSPTTLVPPSSASDEPLLSPPLGRESIDEPAIPFAIPLHPTLKTYRSQSYSVGQLDPETTKATPGGLGGYYFNSRSRSGIPYTSLHRRPSRPNTHGDLAHDPSLLGQLREVEDDDESSAGSEAGVQISSTQARTIEQMAIENALLRQATAEQIEENAKVFDRTITKSSSSRGLRNSIHTQHKRVHPTVLEEPSPDSHEELQTSLYPQEVVKNRRSVEYISRPESQYTLSGILENRNLEGIKKGHWQSSLGFGGLVEPPQSRRHSFAEVPTRQTSISSTSEHPNSQKGGENGIKPPTEHRSPVGFRDGLGRPSQGDTASYFSAIDPSLHSPEMYGPSMPSSVVQHGYSMHLPYGRSQPIATLPTRLNQLLYVVTFKACRADVFYVSEGTGLQIRPGDLVIVEADRGTDLGTVAYDRLSWQKAKDVKDFYTGEHYRWLLMFSRQGQTVNKPPLPSNSLQGSAAGTASPVGQPNAQDVPNSEVKPKMIKRLAQAHEIQGLRDKEGNEAKAKRVCQQKVVEHRLNMEILDAEFQMDWKKLTFYYFADAYVNFNPLVTDLFKIYKTRIWMSAINPASFATPSIGLHPSGSAPGAFALENEQYADRVQFKATPDLAGLSQSQQGNFDSGWDQSRERSNIAPVPFPHVLAHHPFQSPEYDTRRAEQLPNGYTESGQPLLGLQSRFNPIAYNLPDLQASSFAASSSDGSTRKPNALGGDWNQALQGLSLGS
ncbi:MAG: hypothetical protein LQ351_001781 [Letrouitia transgressa]|nr:MAG: hypothetical protein LQ351_001781 [Letrouitia transgressa]